MDRERISIGLDGTWRFLRGDEPKAWYKGFDDAGWRTVTVPHDWSVEAPFSQEHSSGTGYLPGGTAWYRKTFDLPTATLGRKVTVTFGGVYNHSQVWCNSYYLGKRPFGYSTFTYDITDFVVVGAPNVLSVRVDHKDIADSRWFTGSGIYRSVSLTVTDRIHVEEHGVFATTPRVTRDKAAVAVQVRLSNETADDAELEVGATLLDDAGHAVARAEAARVLPANARGGTDLRMSVAHPRLWSPDSPYLYTLRTEVRRNGELVDQVVTPVGIRWFSFDPRKGFFLNGSGLKLKGVCIHHDAGCLGAAVPVRVWERRLRELKAMGCNAIRMSHNPPASELLDLCDRMGFLVMDEAFDEWEGVKNKWSTGHNVYPPKHYGYYEDFPDWGERDLKAMVLRDRNHPSIVLWSVGNEIDYPNDPYCHPSFQEMTGNNDANKPAAERMYDPNRPNAERLVPIARKLVAWVKECDATRPVTAALAFPELSVLTGLAATLDVVGYNYKEHLYEEDRRRFPDRVIYGSENGAHQEAWLPVRDREDICGQFLWTGIDYLGEARGWPVRVAQAGLLDLAGFRKPRFLHRRSLWSAEPMAALAVRRKNDPAYAKYPRWNAGESCWNWAAGDAVEVLCYTNCIEAELFRNGRSLGVRRLSESPEGFLLWETTFEEGALEVVAKSQDGTTVADRLETAGAPARLALVVPDEDLCADGQDVNHVEVTVVDAQGRPVFRADDWIDVTVEGPGERLGLENGDPADLEPYASPRRKAYHGRLLAYIRSKPEAGTIRVVATMPGLPPASVEIVSR